MRYLARFDRTAAQLERFLKSKGASPTQARLTIKRLSDLRYLDDHAFAKRWIEDRLARQPVGRERLKIELLAKGVAEALADGVIREVMQEQEVDEEALARRTLSLQRRKGRRLIARQAVCLLRRRGFEEETIERIMSAFGETEERGS